MACWLRINKLVGLSFCALLFAGYGSAQTPQALTLKQAVDLAVKNYPAIRAAGFQLAAAGLSVDQARTAYLPRTDLYLQMNRATRNNTFGLILPNSVIPGISGPVLGEASTGGTWGSAAGLLFAWEPFDFGLRKAKVDLAEALRKKAQAGAALTEYEVSQAAAATFLAAAAAKESVRAAQANVDRLQAFAATVAVLVRSELRPGADESRLQAELARARTELIAAEQTGQEARAALAGWLGQGGQLVEIDSGGILKPAPPDSAESTPLRSHPLVESQSAEIGVTHARQKTLEKSYRPRFEIVSAVYARGSGANVDGTFEGGAAGLAPSRGNWAVGLAVKFPIFDFKENRIRREIETRYESAEQARMDVLMEELKTREERARVQVAGARRIAETTPVELTAARTLEVQARARYQAGLGTVIEVAEAQRMLRQAEVDEALARLGVWRALLALAAARGDMTRLLEQSNR